MLAAFNCPLCHKSLPFKLYPALPVSIVSAGILQHLQETYDLAQCAMVGSSAGALLSVLAACGVQPQAALDRAYELCVEHGVFKRPLGLLVSDVCHHDDSSSASEALVASSSGEQRYAASRLCHGVIL
jgi:predicted acylesterase/phospholipase RssA